MALCNLHFIRVRTRNYLNGANEIKSIKKEAGRPKLAQQMQLYPVIDRQNKQQNGHVLKSALKGMQVKAKGVEKI